MIGRFLLDRIGLVAAFYLAVAAVLAFAGLLTGRGDFGYGLLMATVILLLHLGLELLRWWPFARQAQRLLSSADLDGLAGLPAGGTLDQMQSRELLARLYSLSMAERLRAETAYRQHLTFINMWVHQMKTPVSAISLIAQRAEAQAPEAMASIQEETAKLADGLELVLNMARLQDFASDFHIERVDLLAAVRGIINARRKQFIRTGIFPEVDAPEGDWSVLTDAKWNGFVIEQIVANALKYGAQGGQPGQKLRFRLRRDGNAVTLQVEDQGPGIPEEDLPRIFEPFFTGANGRRFADATGIGLYLVSEVVQKLGHTVGVASELNKGTTVTLTYRT